MRPILILAASVAAMPTPARSQTAVEIGAGAEYEEADYGTGQRIETLSQRTTVRLEKGRLFLFGSLPYHRLEAPANVVVGGGLLGLPIIIDPTQPATPVTRAGLGDLRLGGGYRLQRLAGFDVAVSGEVKLPTASARDRIGTGETDLAFGAEASRNIGAVTFFAGISYTIPGDPEDYRLRDSLGLRSGVAARLSRGVRGSLAYGRARSLSPLVPDEQQIEAGLDFGLSHRLSLGLSGSAGLSDGSADIGAGVRLGWRIF